MRTRSKSTSRKELKTSKVSNSDRRPIPVRNSTLALTVAGWIARTGLSPNQISLLSIVFGSLVPIGVVLFDSKVGADVAQAYGFPSYCYLILAAAGVPLRLLCNLFDGMVAVEMKYGSSPLGPMFNDVPDRITDIMTLFGLGLFVSRAPAVLPGVVAQQFGHFAPQVQQAASFGTRFGRDLGWIAGLAAVLTAYIRYLGAACGVGQHFHGPFAKQQRAVSVAVGLLLGAIEFQKCGTRLVPFAVLVLVIVGTIATIIRRIFIVARSLNKMAKNK